MKASLPDSEGLDRWAGRRVRLALYGRAGWDSRLRQSGFPVKKLTRPEVLGTPKKLWRLGRRKSASMSRTFSPNCASETARLAATVVLPSPPLALVTSKVLGGCFAVESNTQVLNSWNASARAVFWPFPSIRFQEGTMLAGYFSPAM